MRISSNFDGGKITYISCKEPGGDIQLEIPRDSNSDFYQWFYFRLTGARGRDCALKIVNAGGATYPQGWKDYRAVASYDRQEWFRVPTDFDGTVLTIRHAPERDSVYYAYFAPYSMERHADLIAETLASPLVRLETLGPTLDDQDIDLLHIGGAAGGPQKRHCWILARQHPGETMAEWWMEGFLRRLLDRADPVAREVLKRAVFHVVPNMNPDGSRRGNLRTNGAGANLNREWQEPSLERSPEVFLVRRKMEEAGVDFCLDVHGDETIPYNFLIGTSGIPSLMEAQTRLHEHYAEGLRRASPDFQSVHGYPPSRVNTANLTMCGNYVAETFGCLALTLEMPFKDNADAADERAGWSPARCRKLGEANLDAILAVVETLR
jgi:murein tripeptide amidase MpaA